MAGFTVHGDATAGARSTQSRMNRRKMDLEKVSRSRLLDMSAKIDQGEYHTVHGIPHNRAIHLHDDSTVFCGILAFVLVMALASGLKLRREDLYGV